MSLPYCNKCGTWHKKGFKCTPVSETCDNCLCDPGCKLAKIKGRLGCDSFSIKHSVRSKSTRAYLEHLDLPRPK